MRERLAAAVLAVFFSGCTLSTISGKGTGGAMSTSGGSSVGSSTAGSGGSSATGSTTSGSAGATGTASGNGTRSSTGNSTGTSGGTSGGTGGSTSGSSTGDAGPCLAFGDICESNASCCTGACDGTCGQPVGQACLSGSDCSSDNCQNDVCSCSTSLAPTGSCATDADCCDGISCHHEIYPPKQFGRCCDQVGGICQSTFDCCNDNCEDGGHCACLPEGLPKGPGECLVDSDCCAGKCVAVPEYGNFCLNGPGEPCDGGADCYTNACIGGSCGSCSALNGICSSEQGCCTGLVCAGSFANFEENGPQHRLVDAGANCCAPGGSACGDAGDCCSQTCSQGSCACATTAEQCYDDQSCCTGGACMLPLQATTEDGIPVCCQATGQFCLSNADCCTESCADQKCACVATGEQCGPPGLVAPAGPTACCSGSCSDAGSCL